MRFLLSCFLFLPLTLIAQTDTTAITDSLTAIPFVAYWAQGDSFRYTVEKREVSYRRGELEKADTTRYTATFIVQDSLTDGYRIRWRFEDYKLAESAQTKLGNLSLEMQQSLESLQFDELVFLTDEVGTFREIENLAEIQAIVDTFVNQLIESTLAGLAEGDREKMRETLVNTIGHMRNRSYIEGNMFTELQHLLHPMGVEFPYPDTVEYEDEYPNNFGGAPISANGIYYVDSLDAADDYVHIKQLVSLNEEDTKAMLEDYFGRLGMPAVKVAEVLVGSTYEITDDNDYHYYYYPGIPIYIDCQRHLVFNIEGDKAERFTRYLLEWID